ncbi:MAG TPA: MFS transporter [Ktedonobacteraceae bacterium]|nr:MFS transporter [Ktedonobacteraceae bacterium]
MQKTTPIPVDERITLPWRRFVVCALIVAAGFNLRSVMLAVPPVLPLIQHDLGLSYTGTGLLTALPVLVLACLAWPSGFFIDRVGSRPAVIIGLALLAGGTFLRVLSVRVTPGPGAALLFLFTLLFSMGVALTQTTIPVLIRHWFPAQIGFVSALFSDGLIIGEAVAAGITVPLMLRLAGKDGWAATFIFWGVPIVVLFILWLWLAPPAHTRPVRARRRQEQGQAPGAAPTAMEGAAQSLFQSQSAKGPVPAASPWESIVARPNHVKSTCAKDTGKPPRVNALHLGILIGGGSLIYFGMNGWIAPYNVAIHASALTPLALAILNAAQLPVSLAVTLFAQRLAGRRLPFIIAGLISGLSMAGWLLAPPSLEPLWAALLGGSSAFVFTLGIALPPLLALPHEVARLTGITISLTYAVAFVGPFVGGELWDILHIPAMAFLPVIIASLMLIILGVLLPSRAHFGLTPEAGQASDTARSIGPLS